MSLSVKSISTSRIFDLFRFKSQHEGKPCRILEPVGSRLHPVKTDTIVKPEKSKHRKEKAHTDTRASAEPEGIVILEGKPSICRVKESKGINGTAWICNKRVTQF